MKRSILTTLVAVALTLGLAPSATAGTTPIPEPIGGTVSIDVADVIYRTQDCVDTPVTFSVLANDDVAYYVYEWETTYEGPTTMPDGGRDVDFESAEFSGSFRVCPQYDPASSYIGRLTVTFYDYDDSVMATVEASDPFRIDSATALSISRSGTTINGTLRLAGASPGTRVFPVYLQRWTGTAWSDVAGAYVGGAFDFRGNYGQTYRVVFRGEGHYLAAASRAISIPRFQPTLTARKVKYGAHAWKIHASLSGIPGQRVRLQQLVRGTWQNTTKSVVTNSYGKGAIVFRQYYRSRNTRKYRLAYAGTRTYAPARSGYFYLPKR